MVCIKIQVLYTPSQFYRNFDEIFPAVSNFETRLLMKVKQFLYRNSYLLLRK